MTTVRGRKSSVSGRHIFTTKYPGSSCFGLALFAGLAQGCGDGLYDATYPGEPLFEISGVVRYETDEDLPTDTLDVAIVWGAAAGEEQVFESLIKVETAFPGRYALQIFAPPPDDTMRDSETGVGVAFGVPLLVLRDTDPPEPVGGSSSFIVLYLESEMVPPDDAPPLPNGEAPPIWPAGFQIAEIQPEQCADTKLPYTQAAADSVDLYVTADVSASAFIDCVPPE